MAALIDAENMTATAVSIPYRLHVHDSGQRTEFNVSSLLPAPWTTREVFIGVLGGSTGIRYTVISSPSDGLLSSKVASRRRHLLVRHADKPEDLVSIGSDEIGGLTKIVAEIIDDIEI